MFKDENSVRIDMWPDVSEYEKTYPTGLKLTNGEGARFFCSDDESTVETHFRWMEEYGLDGVFFQRFFNAATREPKEQSTFKVTDAPPVGKTVQFADMDGQPTDHYLFLTGEAGKLLRGERKPTAQGELPVRTFRYDGNPFATHHYFADPSAHVWNGRLYVYPSHDIDPPRGCDLMDRYHVRTASTTSTSRILESTGCDTSHGSIVEYKGQWYMFYHNRVLSGRGNLRTLCYDKLYFNDDGTIRPVKQTRRARQPFWKGK